MPRDTIISHGGEGLKGKSADHNHQDWQRYRADVWSSESNDNTDKRYA